MGYFYSDDYLEHHGIKGQKWGIRRFQNSDGTLTEEGKARAKEGESKYVRLHGQQESRDISEKANRAAKNVATGGKVAGGVLGTVAPLAAIETGAAVAAVPEVAIETVSGIALALGATETLALTAGLSATLISSGLLGVAAVGAGAKAIANVIKDHGRKKAEDVGEEYERVADAMDRYVGESDKKKED